MDQEPRWRAVGEALEYWLLAALLAGSFVAGLWGFVRWLFS